MYFHYLAGKCPRNYLSSISGVALSRLSYERLRLFPVVTARVHYLEQVQTQRQCYFLSESERRAYGLQFAKDGRHGVDGSQSPDQIITDRLAFRRL